MSNFVRNIFRGNKHLRAAFQGPQVVAFVPAMALAAFWLLGEMAMLTIALGVPCILSLTGFFRATDADTGGVHVAEVITLNMLHPLASEVLSIARCQKKMTACLLLGFENTQALASRHGPETIIKLRDAAAERLRSVLRPGDDIYVLESDQIAILLGPVMRLDLESALQLATRVQAAAEEPAAIDRIAVYPSCSVGISLSSRLEENDAGERLLANVEAALAEAHSNGPSAIRAWSRHSRNTNADAYPLESEIRAALETGEIVPWFQPQISTETGRVTGVEALARWNHPDRGILPPAAFLPSIDAAGLLPRLSEIVLQETLEAMRGWDNAGLTIATASINMTTQDLDDPRLTERLAWQLDRFNLTPHRLNIEVLEDVVANGPDDVIARNIRALAALGCGIDLDDFGTGQASISALRRFDVSRLKIDRSFITRLDTDDDQRLVVAAVIGMAERLGLDTVAEGVETVGEHALLAQLGCTHVQGFGIARPMPADRIPQWIEAHNTKLVQAPRLPRATG